MYNILKHSWGPLGQCQGPSLDTPSASPLTILLTTLSKAEAICTNGLCIFRNLPFGALVFLSRTSIFFILPWRQTDPSVPAKMTPLRKTFDDPLIKACGRSSSRTIVLHYFSLAPSPADLPLACQGTFSPKPKPLQRLKEATRLTLRQKDLDACVRGGGVVSW